MASGDRSPAPPRALLGVSFPRSGHHFLERLLRAAAGPDYRYCEFYGPPGCCRSVPCRRPGAFRLQKSHDFGLDHPRELVDCLYVIQTREPLGAALSDREMYVEHHGGAAASRADHEVWLGRKAAHYVGFHDRWVAQAPPGPSVLVDYRELRADPAGAVGRVLTAAGRPAPPAALRAAVEPLLGLGDFRRPGYVPRATEDREGYDPELLAVYETIVRDHAPGLAPGRRWEPAATAGTVVAAAFGAARAVTAGDHDGAAAIVDHALDAHPGHALLLHWRAQLARARGEPAVARAAIDAAHDACPDHPVILAELAHVAHAQGDLTVAIGATVRLRDLHADPGHEVLLAVLLGRTGDREATHAQVLRARAARPSEPEHWGYLADAAQAVGETDLAEATRREAHALREQR